MSKRIKHTIVGQTLATGEIIPHQPIVTTALPGDIVFVFSEEQDIHPQWYRVYEDGSKGLRFWCVTMAYAQAVEDASMWAEMAELDDLQATYDMASGRGGYG